MKRLFILRHAKSSWKDHRLDDFHRPLNNRGSNDLPLMKKVIAKYLDKSNIKIEYFLSSPALRTKLTIQSIFPNQNIDYDKRLYNANAKDMKKIIQYLSDEFDTILICGHNTAITSFVNHISDADIFNVPTCAIVEIVFDIQSWHDIKAKSGKLKLFEYPKKYTKAQK